MPIIADGEFKNTMFMNSHESVAEATKKRVFVENSRKRTKLIIMAVLACVIALIIYIFFMSNTAPKTSEKTGPKVQPTKEVAEKDTIINGVLDIKNPVILNSGSSNVKGKGKGKDVQLFVLNPAAAITNSKLSILLTDIEVIDDEVIATLSILNTADAALKLDLSKTYLVNGVNHSVQGYNPNSTSLLSIPQSSSKQEFKLYFKDFHFEGSPYTLKTVLSSAINKNINLYVDINNP